jgi:hypothetical protein
MSRLQIFTDGRPICACRLAVEEEIKRKGFPYLSPTKVVACRFGDRAAQGYFVESVWVLLDQCESSTKNRGCSEHMQLADTADVTAAASSNKAVPHAPA